MNKPVNRKKYKGKIIASKKMDGHYIWRENPKFQKWTDSAGYYEKTDEIPNVSISVEYVSLFTYIRGFDVSLNEFKKFINNSVWCIEDDKGNLVGVEPR